jgi:hypothetical protein
MKKTILIILATGAIILLSSCGAKDNKNELEHYPTYDTTQKMENLNNGNPDSSSSNEKTNSGDIH